MRTRALATVLGLGLVLAGCGSTDGQGGNPDPAEPGDLVLRVATVGGYGPPGTDVAMLPVVSVYADGRVITLGPVTAVYPGPAWPNVQVAQVDDDTVQGFVDAARAAGVTDTDDLGTPPLADAPTTRFTLVDGGQTSVRDVPALTLGPDPGYPPEQQAARTALSDLLDQLTAVDRPTTAYEPTAVAAVAGRYVEPAELGGRPAVEWPGPALPGETVGAGVGCVVATGEQAAAVVTAAQAADALTPWTSGADQWAVTVRPLLPDETDCADLTA